MQLQQPRSQGVEEHKAVFSLTGCLGNVVLCTGEALGIATVHHLQIVEDGEDRDGGELVSHRLQPPLTSIPKLRGREGKMRA